MSYAGAHIIYVFQNPKHCLLTGETRDDFTCACSRSVLLVVEFDRHLGDENSNGNIEEAYLCWQNWPTTAAVGSPSKNLTIRQLMCAQVVLQKQLCSPFCCVLSRRFPKIWRFGKVFSAARDVIWIARGNLKSSKGVYPLWEQPNQARQGGSFNSHRSLIGQWRSWKFRSITHVFLIFCW